MASLDRSAHMRQSAADLAEGLARALRIAEALHATQRVVDLAGFDDLIGRLCARALDLPPDEGRALRPCLAALREQADRFADTLRAAPPAHAACLRRLPEMPPPDH